MTNEYFPDYAIPPGDTLQESINCLFADRCGLEPEIIDGIISGRMPITKDIADTLEKCLDVPARLWMNLEKNYEETLIRLGESRPT